MFSLHIVNNMMGTSGITFGARAASAPFILGIAKSKQDQSGLDALAFSTASGPSEASPQTSRSPRTERKSLMMSRTVLGNLRGRLVPNKNSGAFRLFSLGGRSTRRFPESNCAHDVLLCRSELPPYSAFDSEDISDRSVLSSALGGCFQRSVPMQATAMRPAIGPACFIVGTRLGNVLHKASTARPYTPESCSPSCLSFFRGI